MSATSWTGDPERPYRRFGEGSSRAWREDMSVACERCGATSWLAYRSNAGDHRCGHCGTPKPPKGIETPGETQERQRVNTIWATTSMGWTTYCGPMLTSDETSD